MSAIGPRAQKLVNEIVAAVAGWPKNVSEAGANERTVRRTSKSLRHEARGSFEVISR
jgi:hypothetical protein